MFCRKCKKVMPDDSRFCPACGVEQTKRSASVKARGNGMGTVYKRGKTWTAEVTLGYVLDEKTNKNKRLKRKKGGFKTKTEALNYIQELKKDTAKTVLTLDEYWQSYSTHDMLKLSEKRAKCYKTAWKKLASLAPRKIDTLTVADLRQVVAEQTNTFYPARDMKVLLSHLFKLAGADLVVNPDLPSFIILPENEEGEKTPFTDEELALLWKAWDNGNRKVAIPLILIYTGMMPCELLDLEVENVDLDHQQIVDTGRKTRYRKSVSILLPNDICPVIEQEMEGKTGIIFPLSETIFYKTYYNGLEEAGITRHLPPYNCRHTTATRHAIDENIPQPLLLRIMRWSSDHEVHRYVHSDTPKAVGEALNAVNQLRKPGVS